MISNTQAKDAALATAANNFSAGTGLAITTAHQNGRARAQVNLWVMDWNVEALNTQLTEVGDLTKAPTAEGGDNSDAASWNTRTIGAAQVTETSKENMKASATAYKAAATAWMNTADTEATAAGVDRTRAQELLTDLTGEIAAIARLEITARNALATAQTEQAARVAAIAELGNCPAG